MQPVAVDMTLLKALLGADTKVDVGRLLMVRVASIEPSGRGLISLAGELLDAELPDGVSVGDELKLQIREITPQKVVLGIANEQSQAQVPATPVPLLAAVILPMPQGGSVRIQNQGGSRTAQFADGSHAVTLRYEAPSFGPIDMQFVLDTHGGLRLAMVVPPGQSLASAKDATPQLRQALTDATGKTIALSVAARREPLEVFA